MLEVVLTIGENRLLSVARLALAALGCFLCLGTSSLQSVAADPAELPNTAAGRCAAAYFDAFNSGNNEVMQAFFEEHYALGYLERHPPDARSIYYQRIHDALGRLTTLRIPLSLELQLTVLVDASNTDNVLVMRFQLESKPPHRLAYVTYSGIDKAEVADEYVDYVATRAAPIDSVLRASTVQSIAQALRDQYVYPELGRQMADTLLRKQAEGQYKEAGRAGKLADMLTEDALAVSSDKHIWVEAQNPMVQESSDPVNRPVEELRRENYHFRKVEASPASVLFRLVSSCAS